MKKVLLIAFFVFAYLCCDAQWQSTYRKEVSTPKKTYHTIIDEIMYFNENKPSSSGSGEHYYANAVDTIRKTPHVVIPSSVVIDGVRYPVESITLKYENHSSIRFSSAIEYIDFISSRKTTQSRFDIDGRDRKIDNTNDNPYFIELGCANPPYLKKFGSYWDCSVKAIFANPEKVVLIVPRQYVETYKNSKQWEGAQVFSSKEEYYSYRIFYLDSCQKAKELKERQLQNGTWWDDGVTYIDEDRSVEINDWRFEIDGEGGLYYAMNYENLKKDKEIVSICFLFKVLTNDSDINGHKYVYCSFRPTGSSSSDEKKEDWLCPPTPQDNVRIEYNETPDWNVSDVSTEKVIGVQITKAIIYYRHSTQHLSGFPKNFKVRHSNANSAK